MAAGPAHLRCGKSYFDPLDRSELSARPRRIFKSFMLPCRHRRAWRGILLDRSIAPFIFSRYPHGISPTTVRDTFLGDMTAARSVGDEVLSLASRGSARFRSTACFGLTH